MTDQPQNPNGDAKAIELTRGIHKLRLEVRSYATEHGEPATPADLAAAGYVPCSELEAARLELTQMYAAFAGSGHAPKNPREAAQAIATMADYGRELEQLQPRYKFVCAEWLEKYTGLQSALATERARAEEAERNVLAERTMAKTAERLLDEVKAKLGAANTRVGRLEEALSGLVKQVRRSPMLMGSGSMGPFVHAAESALSAAPQVSTEQVECRVCERQECKCPASTERPDSGARATEARHRIELEAMGASTEQVEEKCDSCQGPLPEPTQVYSLSRTNAAGKRFCRKGCARDWQDANPMPIQTSPVPQVAQASHDRWLAAYMHKPGAASERPSECRHVPYGDAPCDDCGPRQRRVSPEHQLPCVRCGARDHTGAWHDNHERLTRAKPPESLTAEALKAELVAALETSGNEPMKWLARELRGLEGK